MKYTKGQAILSGKGIEQQNDIMCNSTKKKKKGSDKAFCET